MSDIYEIENGLYVDDDGVIVDAAGIDDPLAFVVRRRHEAKAEEAEWEAYRRRLDAVIIKNQTEKRIVVGDVVSTIAFGTYQQQDVEGFADDLAAMPLEPDELQAIIAAAKGFSRELLPSEAVREALDRHTQAIDKRPWVLTSMVRKPAPKLRAVEAVEA